MSGPRMDAVIAPEGWEAWRGTHGSWWGPEWHSWGWDSWHPGHSGAAGSSDQWAGGTGSGASGQSAGDLLRAAAELLEGGWRRA